MVVCLLFVCLFVCGLVFVVCCLLICLRLFCSLFVRHSHLCCLWYCLLLLFNGDYNKHTSWMIQSECWTEQCYGPPAWRPWSRSPDVWAWSRQLVASKRHTTQWIVIVTVIVTVMVVIVVVVIVTAIVIKQAVSSKQTPELTPTSKSMFNDVDKSCWNQYRDKRDA